MTKRKEKTCWILLFVLISMLMVPFKVFAEDSWKLRIESANEPGVWIEGEVFAPQGVVFSNYKIQNVFLAVYDANGKEIVSSLRTNVNVNQYDISKMSMNMASVPAGDGYIYVVAVRDTNGKKNLIKVPFRVLEKSTLQMQHAAIPGNMTEGGQFQPGGTISSNYPIENVFAAIYDANGKEVVSALKHPNEKTYELSKVNFDTTTLTEGNYVYAVAARDTLGRKQLVKTEFQVEKAIANTPVDAYTQKINAFVETDTWKNGTSWEAGKRPTISSYRSSGCCAYAADFVKFVFGHDSLGNGVKFTNPDEIRDGDVLHVSGTSHWIVVLRRNGESLTTAEGNWSGKVVISDSLYTVNGGKLMRKGSNFRTFEKGYHYQ